MATTKFSTIIGSSQVVPNGSGWMTMPGVTITGSGAGSGTLQAIYRINFDQIEYDFNFVKDATAGTGSTAVGFVIPAGFVVNTANMNLVGTGTYASGFGTITAANYGPEGEAVYLTTGTQVVVRKPGTALNIVGSDMVSGAILKASGKLPLTSLAGGYVAQGAGLATSLKPGLVSYYDEYTSPSTAMTNALTSSTTYKVVRIGSQVTLWLPSATGTIASGVSNIQVNPPIPVGFRPTGNIRVPCCTYDANANLANPGMIQIGTGGIINIYKDGIQTANFTAGNAGGLQGSAGLSWNI